MRYLLMLEGYFFNNIFSYCSYCNIFYKCTDGSNVCMYVFFWAVVACASIYTVIKAISEFFMSFFFYVIVGLCIMVIQI